MTWVWSHREWRSEWIQPLPPAGAITGFWWWRRRGGGADILREGSFGSQDNTYPGRELGRRLILNFVGRVPVEGRRAG